MKNLRLDYVKNGELEKEITIAENFITRSFEVYCNREFRNLDKVEGLIKVMLDAEEGLAQLTDGIEYNGEKYLSLVTSPGMQKKEETVFKCEYLFIKEKYKQFIEDFERVISGNKIDEQLKSEKNMCLVKDIVARVGLATSGAEQVEYNPKIVILPEATYNLTNKYTYLETVKDEEGNVIDGEFKTGELEREFTANDGGGLISNHMAEIIQKQLKLNYRVDFAIIRYYKALAVKGLVLRFDFQNYIKENLKENTDFCKCENGIYYIKDFFGEWKNIDEIDLLLNESQVKWVGNWSKTDSLKDLEKEYQDEFYNKYRHILDCLYITKTNKNPNKLKTHTKVNYQVLQNTCLTAADLIELAKPTVNYYEKLLDFKNLDEIRLFLGDIANTSEEINEDGTTEEAYVDTIATKLNFILKNCGEDALKMRWVKSQVARLINKQLKELSGGKIWLEGGYKLGALDPVSYCNWIMTRDFGKNGLAADEYYVAGSEGNRTLYRNPIALYQELQKVTLVNELDKWLGDYTPELLFFNAKDNRLFLMSTADLDGDGFGCIKNDLLYDCVVDEEYPFINIVDGKNKVPHDFTREQLYKDVLASSGNIIGNIAISNCKLNALITSLDNYVLLDENDYYCPYTYNELRELYIQQFKIELEGLEKEERKAKNKEITKGMKKLLDEKKANKKCYKVKDYDNKIQREIVKELFYRHKHSYFYILLASQLAIDMPKTLAPIPEWLQEKLKQFSYFKKPVFMHYLGKCDCEGKGNVNNCKDILKYKDKNGTKQTLKKSNMMDYYNAYIVRVLLVEDYRISRGGNENHKKILKLMKNNIEDGQVNERLVKLHEKYMEIRKKYTKPNLNLEKLNKLDLKTFEKIQELELSDNDIVATFNSMDGVSVRFILTFFFDTVVNKISEQQLCDTYSFIRDGEGEVNWMFENYKKVEVKETKIADFNQETKENLFRKNDIIKLNFKLKNNKELIELENITVKVENDNYNVYVNEENVGTLFADHKKKFNVELLDTELQIKEFKLHESISKKTNEKYNWVECYYWYNIKYII